MSRETKVYEFKLDEVNEEGVFLGYAAVFGNVDLGDDIIEKGAFVKSLKETGPAIPILDHHNPAKQIGWNLEAREDERGLFVKGELNLGVQAAREKHALMKQAKEVGGRTGLSIGFQTMNEEPDKDDIRIRHLTEIKLLEYSIVTFPMNEEAGVSDVKHRQRQAEVMQAIKELIARIKSCT